MSRKKRLTFLVEILNIVILLGVIFGVAFGIEKSWTIFRKPLVRTVLDIFKGTVNTNILIVAILFAVYSSVIRSFRRFFAKNPWLSYVASGVLFLPPFLYLGYRINQFHLPAFLTIRSLFWNGVIGVVFLIVWFFALRIVYPWTQLSLLHKQSFSLKACSTVKLLGMLLSFVVILNMIPCFDKLYSKEEPFNIIVILIDALRADHLGCYGYSRQTSPNIDELAKAGVIFKQAISQSTFTKSSIASLFTGKYPYHHQVYWGNKQDSKNNITSDVLSEDEMTLAEALLHQKYITSAWVNNVHLKSHMGFSQGFTIYSDREGSIEWINKKFLRWLEYIGIKYKTFTYLHFLDLHDPYNPKAPYDTLYGKYSDFYSQVNFKEWGAYLNKIREKQISLEDKDVKQLISYYDGLITYIDNQLGRLFAELKKKGVYDRSMIIFTADHGDAFMEHGFISHSFVPYDELLKVPLIIKFPRSLYAGKVIEDQVRLIDLKPTIMQFLNVKLAQKVDGHSLLTFLDQKYGNDTKGEFPQYAVSEIAVKGGYPIISVRTGDFKYIHFQNKKDEFYNLRADPLERENSIDVEKQRLEPFKVLTGRIVAARALAKTKKKKISLDEETVKKLKALGYIK
ncbi:MAG: sulfatase-like hydrolase/transferase [bacterium]